MNSKAIRKQLLAAVAMVLVAAVALSSSTYAWFAANTQVKAQGMKVQATAENGLLIANANKGSWASIADAVTASAVLFPTSTKDVSNWYHAVSTEADNAQASQAAGKYANLKNDLKTSATGYGVGYIEKGSNTAYDDGVDDAYYLLNTFLIKSSSADMSGITLYINDVTVTKEGSATTELNKSLRVAITLSGDANVYVYAPVDGATATYKVGGNTTDDFTPLNATTGKNKATTITQVKATTEDAITASIYVFYEGEDAACKSTNITGMTADKLSVTVQFGTSTIA